MPVCWTRKHFTWAKTTLRHSWPPEFPDDIAVQVRAPYEARADAIMYRHLLAERAEEVLRGPRAKLGPPWTKDHRVALAATVVAGEIK